MTTRLPLLIACVTSAVGGYAVPAGLAATDMETRPRFREVAASLGLRFSHDADARGEFRLPEIMGSGVALFDYDRDGDLDVLLPQTARNGSRLFQNRLIEDRALRFVDVTDTAGLTGPAWAMGVAVGDYDNDGDPDVYVTSVGSDVLYRNDSGRFTDVTGEAAVDDPRWNASAAFVDYDADGDLDLFSTAYVDFSEKGNKPCYEPGGQRDYCLPAEYRPLPDRLFRNDGHGRFLDVTAASGIGSAAGAGLGVVTLDANGDGRLDLYVANDGMANHLWVNAGDGTFTEEALLSGVAYNADGRAEAGMGVAAADFDEDGDEDVIVTNLIGETNTLYVNHGQGRFEDATARSMLAAISRRFTGFGVGWVDVDVDGRLDLFIANGAVSIVDALRGQPYPYRQRNQIALNDGRGGFREVSSHAGPALDLEEVGRGAAFGDIDNDGDEDIVVSNNNGPVRLLLNETPPGRHWLSIRLEGTRAPRDAQGATVHVLRKGASPLVRRAHTDGSYLSANDPRVFVALGDAASVDSVVVEWKAGERERWSAVAVDRTVTLRQGTGVRVPNQEIR